MDYSNELKRKKKAQNFIGVFLINQHERISNVFVIHCRELMKDQTHTGKKLQTIIATFSKHNGTEKNNCWQVFFVSKCFLLSYIYVKT